MVGKEEDWAYFEISLFLDKFNYTLYYLGKFMLYFADSNLLQAWLFGFACVYGIFLYFGAGFPIWLWIEHAEAKTSFGSVV